MGQQNYYFARAKMNFPDFEVPESWKQFREEKPYVFEMNLRISDREIIVEEGLIRKYGRANVVPYEDGWLFISRHSNWMDVEITCKEDIEKLEHRAYGRLYASKNYSDCIYYSDAYYKDTIANLHTAVDAALPLHGGSVIHASCVKYQDQVILFCGPSGMGKSTQARLWEQHFGAYMLSSDAPAVYPMQEGAIAYGMPWDGSDQIMLQESAPVAAVIELHQAKENRISKMDEKQAFQLMMKQGHLPMWDDEAMFMEMAVLKKLAMAVPFYRLDCRPDREAAELVHRTVFA